MKDIYWGPLVVLIMCVIIIVCVAIDYINRWRKRA